MRTVEHAKRSGINPLRGRTNYFPMMIMTSIFGIVLLLSSLYLYSQIKSDPGAVFFWPKLLSGMGIFNMLIYLILFVKITARGEKYRISTLAAKKLLND